MINKVEGSLREIFFRYSTNGGTPWEINRPQTAIIKLVEQNIFHGEVLDIGCGFADNSIHIVKHAHHVNVTAIDLVPNTIEIVREKIQKENVPIQCDVVDILKDLSKTEILKQHFYDIILDSAVFHVFGDDDRLLYLKNVEYLIKPGGLYIQLCFSEKELREGKPRRITKSDLNEIFSSKNGWTIESIKDTIIETNPPFYLAPTGQAYLSLIRRNKT